MREILLFLFVISIIGAEIFCEERQLSDCDKKGGVYIRQYGGMGVCLEAKEIKK